MVGGHRWCGLLGDDTAVMICDKRWSETDRLNIR